MTKIHLTNVAAWYEEQTIQAESGAVRQVLLYVGSHLEDFVDWPLRAGLALARMNPRSTAGEETVLHGCSPFSLRLSRKMFDSYDLEHKRPDFLSSFRFSSKIQDSRNAKPVRAIDDMGSRGQLLLCL